MRSILRDPGAEVIVGLLCFSASFVGIGLAVTALSKGVITGYSYAAFAVALLFLLGAITATILLIRHFSKIKGYTQQMGLYLREGYTLRQDVLDKTDPQAMTPELEGKVTQ